MRDFILEKEKEIFYSLDCVERGIREKRKKYFKVTIAEYCDLTDRSIKEIYYQPTLRDIHLEQEEYDKKFNEQEEEIFDKWNRIIKRLTSFNKITTIEEMEQYLKTGKYKIIWNT